MSLRDIDRGSHHRVIVKVDGATDVNKLSVSTERIGTNIGGFEVVVPAVPYGFRFGIGGFVVALLFALTYWRRSVTRRKLERLEKVVEAGSYAK